MAVIIALLTYSGEKRKALKAFYHSYTNIGNFTTTYRLEDTPEEKEQWFDRYVELNKDLGYQCSEIHFLFDLKKHQAYLRKVADFYNDFLILIQNELNTFKNTVHGAPYILGLKEIEEVMYEFEKPEGFENQKCDISIRIFKLSNLSDNVDENVYEICTKKYRRKKYEMDITTIDNKNFHVVTPDLEKYIRKIEKQQLKNEHRISVKGMMKADAKKLKEAGLLRNTDLNNLCPTRLLSVYFDFKRKLPRSRNMNMEYLRKLKGY